MAIWESRANRALGLLEGSTDEAKDRTWQIFNHILNLENFDEYVSRDFFNVQQTAGGLPEGMDFPRFLHLVAGHVRSELEGSSFDDEVSDEEFIATCLTFDDTIRRHIRFLNGVVHQGAPGEVHVELWNFILASRDTPQSIYSIYRTYLVDA